MFSLGEAIDVGVVHNGTALVGKADGFHVLFKIGQSIILHYHHFGFQCVFVAAYTFARVLGAVHNHFEISLFLVNVACLSEIDKLFLF